MALIRIEEDEMCQPEQWQTFRDTGLLMLINQILHAFGWAIAVVLDDDNKITEAYPMRVAFRGFDENTISANYKKIGKYLKENAEELYKEAWED